MKKKIKYISINIRSNIFKKKEKIFFNNKIMVYNKIRKKYQELKENGLPLGDPIHEIKQTEDGYALFCSYFAEIYGDRLDIYITPTNEPCFITGGIREKWIALGAEKSFLGYPVKDEESKILVRNNRLSEENKEENKNEIKKLIENIRKDYYDLISINKENLKNLIKMSKKANENQSYAVLIEDIEKSDAEKIKALFPNINLDKINQNNEDYCMNLIEYIFELIKTIKFNIKNNFYEIKQRIKNEPDFYEKSQDIKKLVKILKINENKTYKVKVLEKIFNKKVNDYYKYYKKYQKVKGGLVLHFKQGIENLENNIYEKRLRKNKVIYKFVDKEKNHLNSNKTLEVRVSFFQGGAIVYEKNLIKDIFKTSIKVYKYNKDKKLILESSFPSLFFKKASRIIKNEEILVESITKLPLLFSLILN